MIFLERGLSPIVGHFGYKYLRSILHRLVRVVQFEARSNCSQCLNLPWYVRNRIRPQSTFNQASSFPSNQPQISRISAPSAPLETCSDFIHTQHILPSCSFRSSVASLCSAFSFDRTSFVYSELLRCEVLVRGDPINQFEGDSLL